MENLTIDLSKIVLFDLASRAVHLERKLEDEAKAHREIDQAKAKFKCGMNPVFSDDGLTLLGMQSYSNEPDCEQTRNNLQEFDKLIAKIMEENRVTYVYLAIPDVDEGKPNIYLVVTW